MNGFTLHRRVGISRQVDKGLLSHAMIQKIAMVMALVLGAIVLLFQRPKTPVVNLPAPIVNVPAPVVNYTPPKLEPPVIHIPKQPAPIVRVDAPSAPVVEPPPAVTDQAAIEHERRQAEHWKKMYEQADEAAETNWNESTKWFERYMDLQNGRDLPKPRGRLPY